VPHAARAPDSRSCVLLALLAPRRACASRCRQGEQARATAHAIVRKGPSAVAGFDIVGALPAVSRSASPGPPAAPADGAHAPGARGGNGATASGSTSGASAGFAADLGGEAASSAPGAGPALGVRCAAALACAVDGGSCLAADLGREAECLLQVHRARLCPYGACLGTLD